MEIIYVLCDFKWATTQSGGTMCEILTYKTRFVRMGKFALWCESIVFRLKSTKYGFISFEIFKY